MSGVKLHDSPGRLSVTLREVSAALSGQTISLRQLLDLIGEEGMLLVCAVLTLPFLIPVSIPGVSTVFGLAIVLFAIGITINRVPWLPRQILDRQLPAPALRQTFEKASGAVTRIEAIVRPRLGIVAGTPGARVVHGCGLLLGGLLLMVPFGFVPFSNTLPAIAILLLALGLLERDGWLLIGGHLMNVATIVYFSTLVAGALAAGRGLAGLIGG
jgi:hypothetical protein